MSSAIWAFESGTQFSSDSNVVGKVSMYNDSASESTQVMTCSYKAGEGNVHFDNMSTGSEEYFKTYEHTQWFQCLAVSYYNHAQGQYLLMNTDGLIYLTLLSFEGQTFETTQVSREIPGYIFDSSSLIQFAVFDSLENDYFFSGKINMVYETSFSENLGFVGALFTGRDSDDPFMIASDLYESIVVRGVSTTIISIADSSNPTFTMTELSTLSELTFDKNDWIEILCPEIQNEYFLTECNIFDIVMQNDADLKSYDENDPYGRPALADSCANSENYSGIAWASTVANDQNRKVCYPKYYITLDDITDYSDSDAEMLDDQLDEKGAIIWNDKVYPDWIDEIWETTYVTYRDDGDGDEDLGTAGDYRFVQFSVNEVLKYFHSFYQGQRETYSFEPHFSISDQSCNIDTYCWSKTRCTNSISYDREDLQWVYRGNDNSAETGYFIYALNITCPEEREMQTFKFHVIPSESNNGVSPINIFLPYELMYRYFQDSIPYEMVKPYGYIDYSQVDISTLDTEVHQEGRMSHNSKIKAPDYWTDVKIQTAIRESRDRFENPQENKIRIKHIEVDHFGQLTLDFNHPVRFPSYMLEEIENQNSTEARRLEGGSGSSEGGSQGGNSGQGRSGQGGQGQGGQGHGRGGQGGKGGKGNGHGNSHQYSGGEVSTEELLDHLEELDRLDQIRIAQENVEQLEDLFSIQSLEDSCTNAQVWLEEYQICYDLEIFFGSIHDLVDIQVVPEEDKFNDIHFNFGFSVNILSLDQKQIKFEIIFDHPELIDRHDVIEIGLKLNEFEPQVSTEKFSHNLVSQISIDFGKNVKDAAAHTTAAVAVATASCGVANMLLTGALSQIWGMLNGLQILVHLPSYSAQEPAVSMIFIEKLLMIATFDILPFTVHDIFGDAFPIGDTEINLDSDQIASLDEIGYGDVDYSENMGSLFFYQFFTIIGFGLIAVGMATKKIHPSCLRCHSRLMRFFMWNWVIRLILEASIEILFSATLNIMFGSWTDAPFGSKVNLALSYLFGTLVLLLPIFILIFYCCNFNKISEKEFEQCYGSPLSGLYKYDITSIFFPILFVLRRIIFMVLAIFYFQHVILGLAINILMVQVQLWYLITYRPFTDPLLQKLEVFNEVTAIIVIDLMFVFTDTYSSQAHNDTGYIFISFFGINILTHFFFLIRTTCQNIKLSMRRKAFQRRWQAKYAELSLEQQHSWDSWQKKQVEQKELDLLTGELRPKDYTIKSVTNSIQNRLKNYMVDQEEDKKDFSSPIKLKDAQKLEDFKLSTLKLMNQGIEDDQEDSESFEESSDQSVVQSERQESQNDQIQILNMQDEQQIVQPHVQISESLLSIEPQQSQLQLAEQVAVKVSTKKIVTIPRPRPGDKFKTNLVNFFMQKRKTKDYRKSASSIALQKI